MGLFGSFNGLDSGVTGPQQVDFLSNGTWTKPAGLVCAKIYVIGAGGGGGGGAAACLSGPTPRVTAGGGGGGGGGVFVCTLSAASLCSSYCVVIGAGGCGGARAASNGNQGFIGGTGGDSCFGPLIAGGGGPGAAGCFAVTSACIVVQGGAAGSGATSIGQTGGCGRIQLGTGIGPTSPTAANGGRGGGGGAGCADYASADAAGGPQIFLDGIRLGCGGPSQFNPVVPDPLGCPRAGVYGAGGGGGSSNFYAGAQCPSTGGPGTQGFVRVINYF